MVRRFGLVLPSGWERIDLTGDVDQAITAFRRRVLSRASTAQHPSLTRVLGADWTAHLKELAAAGVYCLITSLEAGLFIGQPTLVLSPLVVPQDQTAMDLLIGVAATDPTATLFDVADLVALRTVSDSVRTNELIGALAAAGATGGGALEAEGVTITQRMHRYLLGDPVDPDSWVVIAGTTTVTSEGEASPEVLQAYTDVLDDIVATFRWMS